LPSSWGDAPGIVMPRPGPSAPLASAFEGVTRDGLCAGGLRAPHAVPAHAGAMRQGALDAPPASRAVTLRRDAWQRPALPREWLSPGLAIIADRPAIRGAKPRFARCQADRERTATHRGYRTTAQRTGVQHPRRGNHILSLRCDPKQSRAPPLAASLYDRWVAQPRPSVNDDAPSCSVMAPLRPPGAAALAPAFLDGPAHVRHCARAAVGVRRHCVSKRVHIHGGCP
jgi:hypothetical protein